MDDRKLVITPEFIIDLALRRRWVILLPLCFSLAVGLFLAIKTPRIYEASTLILVEGQRVPENFVQSIVPEDTNQRINTVSHQILSRTNLERIMNEFSLFSNSEMNDMYIEEKVERLRRDISVRTITDRRRQTDAFEITFKGEDPKKVMQVANGIANSFISENIKVRESQAESTSVFLKSELESKRVHLEEVEEKIKNYRKEYMGELPEQLETNLRILERFQDNLSDRQQSLRDAKLRLNNLKAESSRPQPSVVVIGNNNQRGQEGIVSIDELTDELESLKSRYTDQHPDIIRLKKQIAELKSRSPKYDDEDSLTNMPAALRAQFIEVRGEIRLAESEINALESQMAEYQKRVENTPKREQELLSLKRDYENIQTSYDSLLARKLEADIAVNMERDQKGAQFRIVDRARQPEKPVEPNLKKNFLLVLSAGLGLGCGLAYLLEFFNTTFRKPEEIESALNLRVLTELPTIFSPKQMLLKKVNWLGSIIMIVINLGLFAVLGVVTLKGI